MRDRLIKIRVSDIERDMLMKLAAVQRVPLAQLMRNAALEIRFPKPPKEVPALNRRAYMELSSLAANLNRIAGYIKSTDQIIIVHDELKVVLKHACQTLQALRLELITGKQT
jgi:hypothetical protein